jgi:23S rRNA pseudouridine1911/1915/1917 synthase
MAQAPAGPTGTGPWTVGDGDAGTTVAAFVKARTGAPWSEAKRQVTGGKVFVDGAVVVAVDARLRPGQAVQVRASAPRPRDPSREVRIVHDDAHVVVIDKPSGISSVPYDERETGTAMDLLRAAWKRRGVAGTKIALHVVHRIDKATSGLLMFARSKRAEIELGGQLRRHTTERAYLCIAHGAVASGRIESMLVRDRGDGLRGATRFANQGKRAVTHVRVVEPLRGATLCAIRLETGKTHQIRIHLAERGHPLVGEDVYDRDLRASGAKAIAAPRLMLHAATLGFAHPVSGARMRFAAPVPDDMLAMAKRLGGSGDATAYAAAADAMADTAIELGMDDDEEVE